MTNDFTRPVPVATVYTLGTQQTPRGAVTGVAMKAATGVPAASTISLQDGTFVVPDPTSGQIIVPTSAVAALQAAGWTLA